MEESAKVKKRVTKTGDRKVSVASNYLHGSGEGIDLNEISINNPGCSGHSNTENVLEAPINEGERQASVAKDTEGIDAKCDRAAATTDLI